MAKARQHFVPRVLLRRFVDPEPPPGWPEARPFEPSVWVIPRDLDEPPRRRAPKNILFRNHLYTLADDSPAAPLVEEALGQLETAFGATVLRLEAGEDVGREGMETLLRFSACLRVRHPSWMEQWQTNLDNVQRIYRMVDRAHNDSERFSDEFWAGADEAGRRGAIELVDGLARVLAEHCAFIINGSHLPFITSDQAVVHDYLDWLQLATAGFPPEWLTDPPYGGAKLFFWAPLDPGVGLIASPHLGGASGEVLWVDDPVLPFILNEIARRSATDFVVASIADPFGPLSERLVATWKTAREALHARTGLEVVVGLRRLWLPVKHIRRERGEHPLISRVIFQTSDLSALRAVAEVERFDEILEFEEGNQVGFLRGGRLVEAALDSETDSVIESGPGDWSV